ncbi:hypothetical protein M9H77_09011 [Catharanthus roseus]|uniref:Uncharacterized protein n=1 Tax=Catharanthus roseus TaxID=4058 RepID=A0ACC0BZG2_CATRO|nr:hypothetical protein M9H77_09011 [Catharanthus roseus]
MLSWRRKRSAEKKAAKKQDLEQITNMEVVIPSSFRCPISLDLMKDPVTLSTGITYDRDNIEKWIEGSRGSNHHTCPITKQELRDLEPIPNHTLRKMIQEWCVENKNHGIERIPTPRIPITSYEVTEILDRLETAGRGKDEEVCRELVAKIKGKAKESERNKRCFLAKGTNRVLAATFKSFSEHSSKVSFDKNVKVLEEILSVLTIMSKHDDHEAKVILGSNSCLSSMSGILRSGSLSGRQNSVLALIEIVRFDQSKVDVLVQNDGVLEALVKMVKEPICPTTTKGSLLLMYNLVSKSSSIDQNKIRTRLAEMGLVEFLLEIIVESEKSISEKALGVVNEICSSKEGRKRAYNNALTIPLLVKKILRVSDLATEFSVSILWKLLGKNEEEEEERGRDVLIEALQLGGFQKLLLLIQVGCGEKTKEKASDLLKLLNLYRNRAAECIESLDLKNIKRTF